MTAAGWSGPGTHALIATATSTLWCASAAPRPPSRPQPRQRQPPGPRSSGATSVPRSSNVTGSHPGCCILARPPRPPPRLGRRRNQNRDSGQPAHRRHACAVPCRPGPQHTRVRRAEQHRAHLRPVRWAGPAQPRLGSATMPSPTRSASRTVERRARRGFLRPRLPARPRTAHPAPPPYQDHGVVTRSSADLAALPGLAWCGRATSRGSGPTSRPALIRRCPRAASSVRWRGQRQRA